MTAPACRLMARDIACIRGGRLVFAGVTLTAERGQSLLVKGPNGAGKSSLLRMLASLIPCLHGSITHEGSIALADENLALDGSARLGDALRFWAHMDGAPAATLGEAMERFHLGRLTDIPVRMLSTGQRKRAILTRLLASRASIWLLDEPGNGLDRASLAALGEAMADHVAQGGLIVAASHFDLPHDFGATLDLEQADAA